MRQEHNESLNVAVAYYYFTDIIRSLIVTKNIKMYTKNIKIHAYNHDTHRHPTRTYCHVAHRLHNNVSEMPRQTDL
jgi:hypothetical protein